MYRRRRLQAASVANSRDDEWRVSFLLFALCRRALTSQLVFVEVAEGLGRGVDRQLPLLLLMTTSFSVTMRGSCATSLANAPMSW